MKRVKNGQRDGGSGARDAARVAGGLGDDLTVAEPGGVVGFECVAGTALGDWLVILEHDQHDDDDDGGGRGGGWLESSGAG